MMAFMPSCRAVAKTLCGDGLPSEPFHRRLLIRLHLRGCEHCARFARQIGLIAAAAREIWSKPRSEEHAALKRRIIDRLGPR